MALRNPPKPVPNLATEQALARLASGGQYASVRDLLEAFESQDLLIDAYVQGWLPPKVADTLEGFPAKLQCWLLARIIRLHLEAQG